MNIGKKLLSLILFIVAASCNVLVGMADDVILAEIKKSGIVRYFAATDDQWRKLIGGNIMVDLQRKKEWAGVFGCIVAGLDSMPLFLSDINKDDWHQFFHGLNEALSDRDIQRYMNEVDRKRIKDFLHKALQSNKISLPDLQLWCQRRIGNRDITILSHLFTESFNEFEAKKQQNNPQSVAQNQTALADNRSSLGFYSPKIVISVVGVALFAVVIYKRLCQKRNTKNADAEDNESNAQPAVQNVQSAVIIS